MQESFQKLALSLKSKSNLLEESIKRNISKLSLAQTVQQRETKTIEKEELALSTLRSKPQKCAKEASAAAQNLLKKIAAQKNKEVNNHQLNKATILQSKQEINNYAAEHSLEPQNLKIDIGEKKNKKWLKDESTRNEGGVVIGHLLMDIVHNIVSNPGRRQKERASKTKRSDKPEAGEKNSSSSSKQTNVLQKKSKAVQVKIQRPEPLDAKMKSDPLTRTKVVSFQNKEKSTITIS
jgi:hypothetical protein